MNLKKRLIILVFTLLFLGASHTQDLYASKVLYETQIFHESNESKIKKLQSLFKGLWLYNWEITGIYSHIEQDLINYQLRAWVIPHKNDDSAWYFGAKTMKALERDFWNLYLDLKEEFLVVDTPENLWRFKITAYYSPLPWQAKYTTWSYAWDIRLNGNWNVTASWNWMYPWLLAWPRNYAFGTKIYIEWIWVWQIWDRWGAIVNSWERWHEYDRLDIWVWYWDEGRERARKWWVREVNWYIVDSSYEVNIKFDESVLSKYLNLKVDAKNPTEESVRNLQSLFTELSLYSWPIDWDYYQIKDIFIDWQVSNNVIPSRDYSTAWYFWPKTITKLQEIYWSPSWLFIENYMSIPSIYNNPNWENNNNEYSYKRAVELIKTELEIRFDKMFNWNQEKIDNFKEAFKKALNNISNKDKYKARKQEFQYLIEIL